MSARFDTPENCTLTERPPREADAGQEKVTISPSATLTVSEDENVPLCLEYVILLQLSVLLFPCASVTVIFSRTA